MSDFKYDVAFSFVQADEHLVERIAASLTDRLEMFVYSKKQGELAGTDGEEAFTRVFGLEARIVVVMLSPTWGETPWTRIEEKAIRNRAYDEGYGFTVFVPTAPKVAMPKWLPKSQLWVNWERYGPEGAASVIEARVREVGGEIKEITLAQRAAAAKARLDWRTERGRILGSAEGVQRARAETELLFNELHRLSGEVSETGIVVELLRPKLPFAADISSESVSIALDLDSSVRNAGYAPAIKASVWRAQFPPRPGRMYWEQPPNLVNFECEFDLIDPDTPGWKIAPSDELLITAQLATRLMELLLKYIELPARPPTRRQVRRRR